MTSRWRRTRSVWPDEAHISEDDWTLVDDNGERLARIHDLGRDEGVEEGNWRWRVFRPDGHIVGGSAVDGTAAKRECERRVAPL
jgi:hypothetical protein